MHTRLFRGEIQAGKEEEAWQVLNEFAHRVKQHKGCILNQVLRSGREIVGVTTWESQADLSAYADGEVAAGPPPHALFKYPVRIRDGEVEILTSAVPLG